MSAKIERAALWKLSYGLYIVASRSGEKMNGQIANAVIQVTAEPPQIAVAINKENLTHDLIEQSGLLTVSVLDITADMKFIGTFGFKSGRDIDKMSTCQWRKLETGCPVVLDHTASIMEGKVASSLDAGTHTIFLAEILFSEVLGDEKPMTYEYYHNVLKGKASKNAPTFRGGEAKETPKKGGNMKKYVCDICGYVYDPEVGDPDSDVDPGTAFDDLPEDWVCPVCGAGQDDFSEMD